MKTLQAPASWPFPQWKRTRGKWRMVRQRKPRVDPTAGAEPAPF